MGKITISITQETKSRLQKYRKKYSSYNGAVNALLDYFDVVGITPADTNKSPISILKDGTERTIKIIRNIEQKKINPILAYVESLHNENDVKGEKKESDLGLSDEELQAINQLNDELQLEVESLKNEVKVLSKTILDLKENKTPVQDNSKYTNKLDRIKVLIKELDSTKTQKNIIQGFIFEKNRWNRVKDEISNILNY